jgi:hypothetical protein
VIQLPTGGQSVGAMFGIGTYLSVNFSKSDLYADKDGRRRAERTMFIVRVLVGNYYTTKTQRKDLCTPPDSGNDGGNSRNNNSSYSNYNTNNLPYDSLYAAPRSEDGCVDHPEVIIYKENQLLPLYLVRYQHAVGCGCAQCHRRPD